MPRLPEAGSESIDYARFTHQMWEGLNGKYTFYVNRWRRTLEFLRDQHWNTLTEFDQKVLPSWRRFPIQNYTLAFYNDYLTDYLKSEVRFSALPTSADPEDIDAAELSEQLLKYFWNRTGLDRKRIDLGAWIMATGTGVLRVYWDTNTGRQVPIGIPGPDGEIIPVDPGTMQPFVGDPILVDAGEIAVEVVSPQFVRWAENKAHGVMIGLLLSYEEVKTFYGKDLAERLDYSASQQGISADLNRITQPGITPHTDERALVIEHYLPASATNPKGLWWTSSGNGTILVHQPWELPGGVIPVHSFRWIPMPGEKHIGLSPLYGLTFENKIYEEITARILEWYNKAKPKRLLISGGGVAPGDLTDEPFQELVINDGAAPDMLEVQDAPAGLFQLLNLIQNDMAVTSGRTFEEPGELPDGLATQRIRTPSQMKATKAITMAHICSKASWQEVGTTLLHYAGAFYNEERTIAIQGPDKAFLWRKFQGDKLVRDGDLAASVIVDDIPLFPQNRQNLRDTVIALLSTQAGQILFSGPDGALDMERIKGALQATGLDESMDLLDPDVLEARNEQIDFQNWDGESDLPSVQSWQNHVVHWDEHTKIPKSRRFRAWPEEARKALLDHIQETEEILNEQADQETQAMIDQEQQLRRVREQEELRAGVMEEWAKAAIS
ncbi:MAG: hypothetical protein V3W09_04700, partial [Nitrososphaerales archaeon]